MGDVPDLYTCTERESTRVKANSASSEVKSWKGERDGRSDMERPAGVGGRHGDVRN